jgi:hypothetical protein
VSVTLSQGMWLWPNTSTSASGKAAAHRRSRPFAGPVSCTTASRRPARSAQAISGGRAQVRSVVVAVHSDEAFAVCSQSVQQCRFHPVAGAVGR